MKRLSGDMVIDIISRLPIKYVLRCRCVCKSWKSLLSDPHFATTHFNRASTLTPLTNYIISNKDNDLLYFAETYTITRSKHLDFSFITDCFKKFSRPLLMGFCSGYVCFSAIDMYWGGCPCPTNPTYLFNPVTGDHILLPEFKESRLYSCVYGFGLDASRQECKVVLVYLRQETFLVQVHTVGRDYSWRTNVVPSMLTDVTESELMKGELQTSLPLEFNGSIHWIVLSSVDKADVFGPRRGCILSFQLGTEVFGVIPIPEPLQVIKPYFYDSMKYALQVRDGKLSIIYSPETSFVDIWVMDSYNVKGSWIKQYSIRLDCIRRSEVMPLGFRKNGELVLCLDTKGLVSYNVNKHTYKILKVDVNMQLPYWIVPFPFVASLISLKSAYGDSKVADTSGFGNPLQKQLWTIRKEEEGTYQVQGPSSNQSGMSLPSWFVELWDLR